MTLEAQIKLIRRMHREGTSTRAIAAALGLEPSWVCDLCAHSIYPDVIDNDPVPSPEDLVTYFRGAAE